MSDGNTVVFPRKLLKTFILLYKDQPCLWDKDCISYKVKQKRHDAVTKLTKLAQEFDPSATRVHVLRKIESLRACVRREYKKVLESRRTATNEDEVYTPQLWYYDLLSFIFTDEENESTSFKHKAESEAEEDVDEDEHPFETSMEHNYTEYNSSNVVEVPENSSKRFNSSNFEEDKNKRHCTEIDDEYDAIGINVAAKLRNLPPSMRILAEKLINDVLFHAQTNALTSATSISTPDPFK